jgi:hypothetical protein
MECVIFRENGEADMSPSIFEGKNKPLLLKQKFGKLLEFECESARQSFRPGPSDVLSMGQLSSVWTLQIDGEPYKVE